MNKKTAAYLLFAGQDWYHHGPAHADHQLAKELAGESKVLVVSSLGMRMPAPGKTDRPFRRILRKARSTLRYVSRPVSGLPNLVVMCPLSIPLFTIPWFRFINAHSVALQVRLVSFMIGLGTPAVLIVVPTAIDVAQRLPWKLRGYLRLDDHSAADDVDSGLIRSMEDKLFAEADFVAYASKPLLDSETDRSQGKALLLDHGVDLEHFTIDGPVAHDLTTIPHPRLGFFGQIERLVVDIPLLERLADEFPHAHLVLVGRTATDLTTLTERPNVHFLGWREYSEIPAYGRGFDVALCPMPLNQWTDAANPIKVKEYLALGLPVVSTRIADMDRYAETVALAESADEFVAHVARALAIPNADADKQRRRASVLRSGWNQTAATLRDQLAEGSNRA
jgi:glycosyltransferase involved in cell wall biosynthesis